MAKDDGIFRIVHASDIHAGGSFFLPLLLEQFLEKVKKIDPHVVIIAGDLTSNGYRDEFETTFSYLDRINQPCVIIPGNHDARNVGFIHFQTLFGPSFKSYRYRFTEKQAETMQATGCTIVGTDSSNPDLNDGSIGFHRYHWIQDQYQHPDDIKILVLHHHLVGVPGTGKERNIVWDAGDVLSLLTGLDIDLIMSGHKHVPFFWDLNGILVSNSGTVSTRRLRGLTPPSFNEIELEKEVIRVFLHYTDGSRELAVTFKRKGIARGHESFAITEEFFQRNGLIK